MGIISSVAKVLSKTAKNIQTINRRIAYIGKNFGIHSVEYEDITNKALGNLDFTVGKDGIYKIRNTAENRKQHQFIRAQAYKIRSKPIQVLQRQAKKRKAQYKLYTERTNDDITYNEYIKFSNLCDSLYTECYALAETAADAGIIDSQPSDIQRMAVYLIRTSEARQPLFDELNSMGYKRRLYENAGIDYNDIPVDDYTDNEYTYDEETGELITNPNFYD